MLAQIVTKVQNVLIQWNPLNVIPDNGIIRLM